MSLLRVADSFYVEVHDISPSETWYIQELGCNKTSVELAKAEGCVAFVFSKEHHRAPGVPDFVRTTAHKATKMLYAGDASQTWKGLKSRGVSVSAVETDRQATHYSTIRGLEGNAIEVSEES